MKDLHVHSTYCDGENTPRELIEEAILKNMDCIGICAHSYTFFDESWCIKKNAAAEFKKEMQSLKKEFSSKINVLCGIEHDFYSEEVPVGYDYIIGSVHYLKKRGEYLPIDENAEILKDIAENYYSGSLLSVAEDYYKTIAQMPAFVNIIGHFDVITKFNENNALFREYDERYIKAYQSAADKLSVLKIPFEVNTGVVSRGYKKNPYPASFILRYIKKLGGNVILSSDSHKKETLCFGFAEEAKKLKSMGFML